MERNKQLILDYMEQDFESIREVISKLADELRDCRRVIEDRNKRIKELEKIIAEK